MKSDEKKVLVAESEPEIRRSLVEALQKMYRVAAPENSDEAFAALLDGRFPVAIVGENFGNLNVTEALRVVQSKRLATCVVAVCARRNEDREAEYVENGAEAVIVYPFKPRLARSVAGRAFKRCYRELRIAAMQADLSAIYLSTLGYDCPGMSHLRPAVSKMIDSDEPLLVSGEQGVGKELLARAVQMGGRRGLGPFAAINARRMEKEEVMSRIFGDGDDGGALEAARGGALLVHAAGEMPLPVQERLLGAIREGRNDVRFMFTTRIDLHGAALRDEFSPELWTLLEDNAVQIPALRERPKDIPELAQRLVDQYARRLMSPAMKIHRSAKQALVEHSWPGNLAELERVVVCALARASGPFLVAEDLLELRPRPDSAPVDQLSLEDILHHKLKPLVGTVDEISDANLHDLIMSRVEKPLYMLVMEKVEGNQIKAAKALGIHRNTLRKKLKSLGIKTASD